MVKAKLKFKGKIIEIELEKVQGFGKFTGLIKRRNSALLFENLSNKPIHSLFCPKFLAIWLNDNKIIDYKFIESWKLSIKPEKSFNKLIEIPMNEKYDEIIKLFTLSTALVDVLY